LQAKVKIMVERRTSGETSAHNLASDRGGERYFELKEAIKYAAFGLALLVVVGIVASPLISVSVASLGKLSVT